MQTWGKGREVEKVKPAVLTPEQGREIAQAINGAIGLALAKLTGSYQEAHGPDPVGVAPGSPKAAGAGQTGETIRVVATTPQGDAFEELYQKIKRRLIDECRVDPILLQLLTKSAPELRIDIEPRVLELNDGSLRGRIAYLVGSGFFDSSRSQAETIRELKRTGTEPHSGRMSEAFTSLVNDGVLTREGDGYQKAPGVTVTKNELTASRA